MLLEFSVLVFLQFLDFPVCQSKSVLFRIYIQNIDVIFSHQHRLFFDFIRLCHFLQEKAKAEPKKPEQPEVTVLNTLRILSAMETLLGQEQGYKTNILLAQAKSLEAKHGSQAASSQLLQRYVVRETLFLSTLCSTCSNFF